MDYKSLLSLADKNQELKDTNNEFAVKRRAKAGQTAGPNKAVIDAFKARKEREEMEKLRERQKEKERLLSLRAQNSKSMKKALMMKTRTKDNDFSRIVLTEEQLEEQRRVEEKLKRKGAQDLSQNKRQMNELEEKVIRNGLKNTNKYNASQNSGLHRRSDTSGKTKDSYSSNRDNKSNNNNNENRVKARNAKPAMSYEQLLSLATEKSKSEKSSLTDELMSEREEKKQMRPMTQKEKDRLKEELYYKQRANKGLARLPNADEIRKKSNPNPRDVKRDTNSNKRVNTYDSNVNNNNNKVIPKSGLNSNPYQSQPKSDKNIKNTNIYNNNSTNQRSGDRLANERPRSSPIGRQDSRRTGQSMGAVNNKSAIIQKMENRLNSRDKEYNEKYSNASKERSKAPTHDYRPTPKQSISSERARPPSPPPRPRQASPPPRPRRPLSPQPKLPPIGSTYRRGMYEDVSQYVDDDYEEEEDDDMADFIDDGPEEKPIEEDYSRAIREIFGYDKRKYRNIEDDDIEEANFVQCMQEESRSARIGKREDEEEERKEEEEKRRKALARKRMKD